MKAEDIKKPFVYLQAYAVKAFIRMRLSIDRNMRSIRSLVESFSSTLVYYFVFISTSIKQTFADRRLGKAIRFNYYLSNFVQYSSHLFKAMYHLMNKLLMLFNFPFLYSMKFVKKKFACLSTIFSKAWFTIRVFRRRLITKVQRGVFKKSLLLYCFFTVMSLCLVYFLFNMLIFYYWQISTAKCFFCRKRQLYRKNLYKNFLDTTLNEP